MATFLLALATLLDSDLHRANGAAKNLEGRDEIILCCCQLQSRFIHKPFFFPWLWWELEWARTKNVGNPAKSRF